MPIKNLHAFTLSVSKKATLPPMKILNLTLSVLLISSAYTARADEMLVDQFEDTNEFLTPQVEDVEKMLASETWAYRFELVRKNGTTTLLSEKNTHVMLKPASTMKIFTGFWAFKLNNRSNAYIYQMLRQSVNSMADNTAQRMGGVLAMEDYYRDKGLEINNSTFNAADGSGLSYDNKATCDTEIKLLRLIRKDAEYQTFKKLMAQPGKDGTLRKRLTVYSGKLFAKTGTLAKTAALTGFLETSKGTVLFCVMADYLKGSVANARVKIDSMVKKNYALVK